MVKNEFILEYDLTKISQTYVNIFEMSPLYAISQVAGVVFFLFLYYIFLLYYCPQFYFMYLGYKEYRKKVKKMKIAQKLSLMRKVQDEIQREIEEETLKHGLRKEKK